MQKKKYWMALAGLLLAFLAIFQLLNIKSNLAVVGFVIGVLVIIYLIYKTTKKLKS